MLDSTQEPATSGDRDSITPRDLHISDTKISIPPVKIYSSNIRDIIYYSLSHIFLFLKKMNALTHQRCIQLIQSGIKDIYNVIEDSFYWGKLLGYRREV